jgi:Zn-dependent protease with chaperone function
VTAPAIVFGPHLPPAGAHGVLSISALGVEVAAGDRSQRASLSQVTLREVGFDRPGLEIAWRDADGAWAAHVLDPVAAARLLSSTALSATEQAITLKGRTRKLAAGRSIGRGALAAVLVLPLALLVWFVLSAGTIAAWVTERIPVDQEIAMGRQAFAGMRGSLTLQDEGPAYDAVKSIVATLTAGSKYEYEVHVVDDATLNAFAMPGGVIVVHSGLIEATRRPEELAGVLAHEVQHVELRHSLRALIKELGLRGLWSYATGDLGGTVAGQAALELTSLSFSRDDEREADEHGLATLVAAGIDPAGMPDFFQLMTEKTGDAPAAFISTHPLSEDRERDMRQRLETMNRGGVVPLSFEPWPPRPNSQLHKAE